MLNAELKATASPLAYARMRLRRPLVRPRRRRSLRSSRTLLSERRVLGWFDPWWRQKHIQIQFNLAREGLRRPSLHSASECTLLYCIVRDHNAQRFRVWVLYSSLITTPAESG